MPACPRTACPICDRPTALTPTSRTGYGALAGHKREKKSLTLCPGSMVQLAYATATAWQEQLPEDSGPPAANGDVPSEELLIF
ncbi:MULTISPECIES: hypothetical protein [Streptomyces]|uniref:Uncharacterized protein n=1 Tax=Streptomyces virginiae TaxID=1961 RepID=A0ABZ1TNG6_STRVG|nr:hypothetical protein [Streptomyces virginiae]WST50987.1 hypothetical protein OG592_42945 [Streptomyces avidinii]